MLTNYQGINLFLFLVSSVIQWFSCLLLLCFWY